MKLLHRFGYFSVGLFFGIIILIFFLGGKRASCDYTPNARVIKDISTKKSAYSPQVLTYFAENNIDTADMPDILKGGDVDFNRSKTRRDPCNLYLVSKKTEAGILELQIENCDSLATFRSAALLND